MPGRGVARRQARLAQPIGGDDTDDLPQSAADRSLATGTGGVVGFRNSVAEAVAPLQITVTKVYIGAAIRALWPVFGAGWSSPVARQAHNLKVAGSNPAPATTFLLPSC